MPRQAAEDDKNSIQTEIEQEGAAAAIKGAVDIIGKILLRQVRLATGVWRCCKRGVWGESCKTYEMHVCDTIFQDMELLMETDQACTAQAPCLAGCSLWTVSGCKLAMGWGASRGGELARVTVLGYAGSVCYDQLVRPPRAVLDYNTRYSGITQASMEGVTTSLGQVQMDLVKIISSKDIIVGHSLQVVSHSMFNLGITNE